MRIVHVMAREKFTSSIAGFYDLYFPNHSILYRNVKGAPSLIDDKLKIEQNEYFFSQGKRSIPETLGLFKKLKKYDFIVLHSMSVFKTLDRILALFFPSLVRKLVWIEWGADLYEWKKNDSHNVSEWMIEWIRNRVNYMLRIRIPYVVCIFPPDEECYRSEFVRSDAKTFYAPYCGSKSLYQFRNRVEKSRLSADRENGNEIVIQVGQNAMSSLNHVGALCSLRKFRNRKIKIFLPLSYGGKGDYAEKVKATAENMFKEKAYPLMEFMPADQYFDICNGVDIAVFNTYRQAGLGNIHRLIWNRVKVYLPKDSVMYKYFKGCGVPVQAIEQIASESFEEFISDPVVEDEEKYTNFLRSLSEIKWKVEKWREIYNYLDSIVT